MKIGGFNINYKYLADYEFFCRLGFQLYWNDKKIVSKWRIHENQATIKMEKIYKELLIFYLKIFFFEFIKYKNLIMKLLKL